MDSSGFGAYAMYHALWLHFTGSYDYFKYHGKTKVDKEKFSLRKDKYGFYKLSRKYSMEELKQFFLANFLQGNGKWVGELTGPVGEDIYKKWQKRNQSLSYVFQNDIIYLFNKVKSPNDLIEVKQGQHPILLSETMSGTIAIETLIILNDIMNFFPMWRKKVDDDIIFPEYIRRCEKYSPFIVYDKNKFKEILKKELKNL